MDTRPARRLLDREGQKGVEKAFRRARRDHAGRVVQGKLKRIVATREYVFARVPLDAVDEIAVELLTIATKAPQRSSGAEVPVAADDDNHGLGRAHPLLLHEAIGMGRDWDRWSPKLQEMIIRWADSGGTWWGDPEMVEDE